MTQEQATVHSAFSFERKEGKASGTLIFDFSGPFTARAMYAALAPVVLDNLFAFQSFPGEKPPALNVLDLTDVPYMDSRGLGLIVRHYAHCKGIGVSFVIVGASKRVLELFKITRVDAVLPLADTVEEAEKRVALNGA